jgi:hypothetical protein
MALIIIHEDISDVLIERVNKSDARKLISWWNAHTPYYHFKRKSGKLYDIIRQKV